MEKLIELLNEYYHRDYKYYKDGIFDEGCYEGDYISDIDVISKEFGFIKWLVESDKIDGPKIREKNSYIIDTLNDYTDLYFYEKLLMLLSIQDNSIDFLVSILK